MKVRASVKKIGPKDKIVRRKNRSGTGPGRVFVISENPKHKQRQG